MVQCLLAFLKYNHLIYAKLFLNKENISGENLKKKKPYLRTVW